MRLGQVLLCVGIVLILVTPGITVASKESGTQGRPHEDESSPVLEPTNLESSGSESQQPAYLSKIQPSLLSETESKVKQQVIVATTDAASLWKMLEGKPYVPSSSSSGMLALPLVEIPGYMLDAVASLPTTLAVLKYEPPQPAIARSIDKLSRNPDVIPNNLNSSINHGVQAAWKNGFMGDGVTIAVVDDGVDFAHPDLYGTQARFNVSKVDPAVLEEKPYLRYYDGWPIAFDPASLYSYLVRYKGYAVESWYANTSSTDRNVTHRINVDGRNDFWDDGSELIATDPRNDIRIEPPRDVDEGNDFDLSTFYVTQDEWNWYFGFNTYTNQTNVSFGIYINTSWPGGASDDPRGNYINAVYAHRPEFAIYFDHNGLQPQGRWDKNDTIQNATIYKWDVGWDAGINVTEDEVGGNVSYSGWDYDLVEGFCEVSVPKKYLGNPSSISVELFSAGYSAGTNRSHAQDTAYSDPNVDFSAPSWDTNVTTLSAFTTVGRGFWRHTYTRPDDMTAEGKLNTNFTWPLQYIVTGTSKSGDYLFGYHPDENYPLSRVLVVDEAEPHVYDTVYVDLDHNKDFRNDKPLKKYGKYDAQMHWHPPDWVGVGQIYDETSYMDFYDPAYGVTSVSYSPDGSKMASASNDHTVVVWNATDGSIEHILNAHSGRVTSLAWKSDSRTLAAGYSDPSGRGNHNIVIWDVESGTTSAILRGHTAGVNSVAWSADGSKIVSASSDGTVRIWDVSTASQIKKMTDHTMGVNAVDWSHSTGMIASGSDDDRVIIWDGNGNYVRDFTYSANVTAVRFNPNGSWLASGYGDGAIIIWDVSSGVSSSAEKGHYEGRKITSISWSPSAVDLLSTSDFKFANDPTLVLWKISSLSNFSYSYRELGAHDEVVSGETYGRMVGGADWAPNGTGIASGGMDLTVKTWKYDASATPPLNIEATLRQHKKGSTDYARWDTGDGIPDVSGGTVYFIAQNHYDAVNHTLIKVPIPYSDVYVKRNLLPEDQIIPENGTLVAFMGALDLFGSHGTLIASSIVGKGKSVYYDDQRMDKPSKPQVIGFAPHVKIIPVGDIYLGNFYDGWYFAVEGYDGIPGTGDEALIVTNSFGFPSTYEDGWDFPSRFLDKLILNHANGKVTFTVSAGNSGYGYGTVTSPAASTGVISVGASTDFQYRRIAGLEKGSNPTYGEITPESSRGPSAIGWPEPDVVANGRMAFGDTPLNQVTYRPYDGTLATDLWAGTSLSSPCAAAILALVYQAFYKANGRYPTSIEAQSILMSGSDDLSYDILSQGSGRLNADRATRIADDISGFSVYPNYWVPGNYHGVRYESFARLMHPGESESQNFTVQNRDPSASSDVEISDAVFREIDEVNFTFKTVNKDEPVWNVLWVADPSVPPGVYDQFGSVKRASINRTIWLEADLLKITIFTNQSSLDTDLDGTTDKSYFLDVYDWTWRGAPPKLPSVGSFTDLNRLLIAYPDANIYEGRIHNPAQRTHTGLVFGVRPAIYPDKPGAEGILFKASLQFYKKQDWNWLSFDKTSVSLEPKGLVGDSATFKATIRIGDDATIGSYEGAIYLKGDLGYANETTTIMTEEQPWVRLKHSNIANATVLRNGLRQTEGIDYFLYANTGVIKFNTTLFIGESVSVAYWYKNVTTIPVLVNVPSDTTQFSFGGFPAGQDVLFGNRMHAGFGNSGQSGDWRFYFVDVPYQGTYFHAKSVRFFIDVQWDFNLTDIDAFAFGPGGSNPLGITLPNDRYGPYPLLENNGGSDESSAFFTTTGSNREITAPFLTGGLNVIAIHQVKLNGTAHSEVVRGNISTMEVVPSELKISTKNNVGSREVSLHSTAGWKGIGGLSAGPSLPMEYKNLTIYQDKTSGAGFIELLSKGSYTKKVLVKKSALIFEVHITSDQETTAKPCRDLDLGIFLDGLGPNNVPDGIAQPEEFVTYDADSDADEKVRIINPKVEDDPDTPTVNELIQGSPYLIKVLGYSVFGGSQGTFNLDITLVQGENFEIGGLTNEIIPPNTVRNVSLSWSFDYYTPESEMLGALYVGPSFAPLTLLIPVELAYDRTPPTMSSFVISTVYNEVNYSGNIRTTESWPTLGVSLADKQRGELNYEGIEVFFDGENVTAMSSIVLTWSEKKSEWGYYDGTVSFKPPSPLSDGLHNITFRVRDKAGNLAEKTYFFVVDTQSPPLALDTPSIAYTSEDHFTIEGYTERGATVQVRSEAVEVDENGHFSKTISLMPGENIVNVRAVDWFSTSTSRELIAANDVSMMVTIISDSVPPAFSESVSCPSATNKEDAQCSGRVEDLMSVEPPVYSDYRTIHLSVGGIPAEIQSDGGFVVSVPLQREGVNSIQFILEDSAGNKVVKVENITRDTILPQITLNPVSAVTHSSRIKISGIIEPGTTLTLNGRLVETTNNAFETEVDLSPGANVVILESRDLAGNVGRIMKVIDYQPPTALTALSIIGAVVALVIGLIAGYFLSRRMGKREEVEEEPSLVEEMGKLETPEEEKIEVEEAGEEELEPFEEVEEEPEEAEEEVEDERILRLKKALKDGRITEEIYEQNLRRLKGE